MNSLGKKGKPEVDQENKPARDLPFNAPVSRAPLNTIAKTKTVASRKRTPSRRKAVRNARKDIKSPISVRNLFTGLVLLIGVTVAVIYFLSPSLLKDVTSGDFVKNSQICKVTETNSSLFFDTSCGKFEWDSTRYKGTPRSELKKGHRYKIDSVGVRINPAQVFPYVEEYSQVKGKKR